MWTQSTYFIINCTPLKLLSIILYTRLALDPFRFALVTQFKQNPPSNKYGFITTLCRCRRRHSVHHSYTGREETWGVVCRIAGAWSGVCTVFTFGRKLNASDCDATGAVASVNPFCLRASSNCIAAHFIVRHRNTTIHKIEAGIYA